jgi:hypothetical protein
LPLLFFFFVVVIVVVDEKNKRFGGVTIVKKGAVDLVSDGKTGNFEQFNWEL